MKKIDDIKIDSCIWQLHDFKYLFIFKTKMFVLSYLIKKIVFHIVNSNV